MNKPLLRRIQKHIAKEPKRLVMGAFVMRKGEIPDWGLEPIHRVHDGASIACEDHPFAKCGTAACIAGWAVLLTVDKPDKWRDGGHVEVKAQKLLELKNKLDEVTGTSQVDRLFHVEHWPSQFMNAYEDAATPAAKARATIGRIDHFMKTDGAE